MEQASQLTIRLMAKDDPAYLNWIQLYNPDRPWVGIDLEKNSIADLCRFTTQH